MSEGDEHPSSRRTPSGNYGTWTPTDDFLTQRRKTRWCKQDQSKVQCAPPRAYVDSKTLIREVTDIATLRRGDHCLTSLNPARIISPTLDYIFSLLGIFEVSWLFHHFVMLHDVHSVDEYGVPRTADGSPVEIVEASNTPSESLAEVYTLAHGSLLEYPGAIYRFFLNKASVHRCPLVEYGDTGTIFRVIKELSAADRDKVVREALKLTTNYQPYNLLSNNCEHAIHMIAMGQGRSPLVVHLFRCIFRLGLGCVGLFFLSTIGSTCYSSLCISYPIWALLAYHLFTSVPVALQLLVSYFSLSRSVWQQYKQAVIDRDDCYHVLTKESCRVIVGGGLAITTISLMPKMILDTQQFLLASLLCIFAYMASDIIYGMSVQVVMRQVLVDWRFSAPSWVLNRCHTKDA